MEIVSKEKDFLLLGGGSNMLLVNDIDNLVVHLNSKGKEIIKQDDKFVWLRVAAGENWHDFVLWCLENNYGGIENLALIPGNVGTCPIQNIGAYGVEVKDVIEEVHAIEIETSKEVILSNFECKFSYRDSIFKNTQKGKYILTGVTFKLSTKKHAINDSYGAIQTILAEKSVKEPTIKDIADSVIAIRSSKLPDPDKIGNSGSFFKNPIVPVADFKVLQKKYPSIPSYAAGSKLVKLAAGWLIDQCGLKGKRIGDAGVHQKQALVLVNYGNATGENILDLAKSVQKEVKEKFGVTLEMEVNIIK